MDELAGTENRIAVERMRYNETVQAYNTSRRQFPANITAGIFGFKGDYKLFEAPPNRRRSRRKSIFHAQNPRLFEGLGVLRDAPNRLFQPSTSFLHPN